MANDQDNEERLEGETSQQQNQQPSAQQGQQSAFGQQPQQAEFSQGNQPNPGFEPSDTDMLSSSDSEEDFGRSDGQSSGFIGQESAGSDDYLQTEGQGDLASEDALDSDEDGGAGMEGGQSR